MRGRTHGILGTGGNKRKWTISCPAGIEARQAPRRAAATAIDAPLRTLSPAVNVLIRPRGTTTAVPVPDTAIPEMKGEEAEMTWMTPTADAAAGRDR